MSHIVRCDTKHTIMRIFVPFISQTNLMHYLSWLHHCGEDVKYTVLILQDSIFLCKIPNHNTRLMLITCKTWKGGLVSLGTDRISQSTIVSHEEIKFRNFSFIHSLYGCFSNWWCEVCYCIRIPPPPLISPSIHQHSRASCHGCQPPDQQVTPSLFLCSGSPQLPIPNILRWKIAA